MNVEAYLQCFKEDEVDANFPNARRFLTGSLFVSHAGADRERIFNLIEAPVLMDRFGDGFFVHSRGSGGSKFYKVLVRAALHWCDKFIVVISHNVENHIWVRAEIEWLIKRNKPIIACQLEDASYTKVHPNLLEYIEKYNWPIWGEIIDFRKDTNRAQEVLAKMIDSLLKSYPYPRFANGAP